MENSESLTTGFTKELATEIENTYWYLWLAEELLEENKNKNVKLKVVSENEISVLSIRKLEFTINISLSEGVTFEILQRMIRNLLIRNKEVVAKYEEEIIKYEEDQELEIILKRWATLKEQSDYFNDYYIVENNTRIFTLRNTLAYCYSLLGYLQESIFQNITNDKVAPIEKLFLIDGNYKQICYLFANFYNNKMYKFDNSLQEMAVFIDKHFYFSQAPYNPSLSMLLNYLKNETGDKSSVAVFPDSNSIRLKWTGESGQLISIFKKIHIPKRRTSKDSEIDTDIELHLLDAGYNQIGGFLMDNFVLTEKFKSLKTLATRLSRPIDEISANPPKVDWEEIKKLK